jgi:NhaP-type Na+/H+ or K+/H+ antiporter
MSVKPSDFDLREPSGALYRSRFRPWAQPRGTVRDINIAILVASTAMLAIGLTSRKLVRINLSPPLVVLAAGVLSSHHIFGLVHLPMGARYSLLEDTSRFSLAIALTGTNLALPRGELLRIKRPVSLLLIPGMLGSWAIASLLIHGIVGASFPVAMLAGAALTPTDPILARTISEGEIAERFIPARMRYLLLAESSFNDGLAFPCVLLAMALLLHQSLLSYWVVHVLLWSVIGGIALGAVIGKLSGMLLRASQSHEYIARRYYLALTVLLALFSVMLGHILGMDGIFTVAVAAFVFRFSRSKDEKDEAKEIQTTADLFFTLPVFFLLGLVLPWRAWFDLGWRAVAIVAGMLVLKRLLVVLLIWRGMQPHICNRREALFAGWFGPTGVSTLVYITLALHAVHTPIIWTIGTLIITMSVVIHGVTATPLSTMIGRWERSVQSAEAG